jgi:hypothetical protein
MVDSSAVEFNQFLRKKKVFLEKGLNFFLQNTLSPQKLNKFFSKKIKKNTKKTNTY